MTATDLYDFETVFEAAAVAVFVSAGFNAYDTATAPQFQKIRPRVEIIFKVGSATTPSILMPQSDGVRVDMAYSGQFQFTCITATGAGSKVAHNVYRSQVRAIASRLGTTINGVGLTNHKLQFIRFSGGSLTMKPEDGLEMSNQLYSVDFSIQANSMSEFPATE